MLENKKVNKMIYSDIICHNIDFVLLFKYAFTCYILVAENDSFFEIYQVLYNYMLILDNTVLIDN